MGSVGRTTKLKSDGGQFGRTTKLKSFRFHDFMGVSLDVLPN